MTEPNIVGARNAIAELSKAIDSAEFGAPESTAWRARAEMGLEIFSHAMGTKRPPVHPDQLAWTVDAVLSDVIGTGEILVALRESIRQALTTRLGFDWRQQNPEATTRVDEFTLSFDRALIASIIEELSRNAAQAVCMLPVPTKAPPIVIGGDATPEQISKLQDARARTPVAMRNMVQMDAAELQAYNAESVFLARAIKHDAPMTISHCSVCGRPAHTTETDDLDRCAECRGEVE